jgi:hypothetical protein
MNRRDFLKSVTCAVGMTVLPFYALLGKPKPKVTVPDFLTDYEDWFLPPQIRWYVDGRYGEWQDLDKNGEGSFTVPSGELCEGSIVRFHARNTRTP